MCVVEKRKPFHLTLGFGWLSGKCARKLRLLKATSRSEKEKTPLWMIERVEHFFFFPDMIAEGVQQNWSDVWWQLVLPLLTVRGRPKYNKKKTPSPQLHSRSHHYMYCIKPQMRLTLQGSIYRRSSAHTWSGPVRSTYCDTTPHTGSSLVSPDWSPVYMGTIYVFDSKMYTYIVLHFFKNSTFTASVQWINTPIENMFALKCIICCAVIKIYHKE